MQSIAASRRCLRPRHLLPFPLARASTTPFRTADPAIHSETPQEDDEPVRDGAHDQNVTANDPAQPVKSPSFAASPKLENAAAGTKANPTFQQKRQLSLDGVSCVGFDGTPLTDKDERKNGRDGDRDRDRDYFEERKASPLSEIEFADTRKPLSRAMDGEKRDDIWGGEGRGYLIRETVDEALQRAEAMFQAAREGGDPTMPHSRALMRKIQELRQSQEHTNWSWEFLNRSLN